MTGARNGTPLVWAGLLAAGCGGTPSAEPVAEPFVVQVDDVEVAPEPIPYRAEPRSEPTSTMPSEPHPSDLSPNDRKRAAKEAYMEGRKHMKAGDYELAAGRFARADALFPGAAPKYNFARCLDEMGQRSRAIAAYRRFIDSKPGQKYLDRVAEAHKRIGELRRGAP